ncbi:MAG: pilus assembly protein PilP [Burkholderiaceae bacterium]|nr:pilus assembly protein PilP [Burkholderiaceae bacterium]
MTPRGPERRPCAPARGLSQLLAWAIAGTLLAGCEGDTQELQQWMDQQRREVRANVPPLAAPKKFDPVPYAGAQQVDPFSQQKLSVALKQEAKQPSSLLATEMNRRKEPLEAYPLDAMTMVGSVAKGGVPFALLRVDNLLYQVKAGDYLGQNYGRILRITETEVALREVVQDAAGEWTERTATLQLQERGQEKAR